MDAVAVVAVVSSSVVGLSGVLTPAWLAGRAERLAETRRRRDKREAVYIDALEVARLVRDHHVGEQTGDPAPTSETVEAGFARTHADRSVRARIDAYGSPEMRRLWADFDKAWDAATSGYDQAVPGLAATVDELADRVDAEFS